MTGTIPIVLCGETYSQNLGDGIITHSLAYLLREEDKDVEIRIVDLSGRSGFSTTKYSQQPNVARKIHRFIRRRLPIYRRGWAVARWKQRDRVHHVRVWHPSLVGSQLAIIGGGQLLHDNGLEFPLRIAEFVSEASNCGIPVAFFACGVGPAWSSSAHRLFTSALAHPNVVYISVRDLSSRDRLIERIPTLGGQVHVVPDPAIFAENLLESGPKQSRRLGLGIMSPEVLRRDLLASRGLSKEKLLDFWTDLTYRLIHNGHKVSLFTNGDEKDQEFARQVWSKLESNSGIKIEARPGKPEDLLSLIGSYDAIIAQRLHASIAAFSMGIPFVAISWDEKVSQFMSIIGQSKFCIALGQEKVEEAYSLLEKALTIQEPKNGLRDMQNRAQKAVREMLNDAGLSKMEGASFLPQFIDNGTD